ncbi:MAG: TonB-dependent receptor, partial [Ignavibacteriales bacterium]|nr:TonB-dependent receptor [Ignavibacteriales bacterium]
LFEAGLRFTGGNSSFEFNFFHRTIKDAILVDTRTDLGGQNPVFRFARDDEEIFSGASTRVSAHIGSLFVEGNAQYLDHRVDDRVDSVDFPKWSANGGLYFWDKLFNGHLNLKAGVRGRVFSSYSGKEFNQQAQVYIPLGFSYTIPTNGTIDLVIIAHLGDAYVHFIWDNLLDRKYIMTSFYPMPERQLRFGVSWEFTN